MVHWTLFHGVAIIGLILANGFFVAAEFALVSLRATRVEQLLAESRPGARAVAQLRGSMSGTLSAVQFGVTVRSLALGWLGEPVVAPFFERPLRALPHAALFAHVVSAGLAFACITYLEVILGELVPKSLALRTAGAACARRGSADAGVHPADAAVCGVHEELGEPGPADVSLHRCQ